MTMKLISHYPCLFVVETVFNEKTNEYDIDISSYGNTDSFIENKEHAVNVIHSYIMNILEITVERCMEYILAMAFKQSPDYKKGFSVKLGTMMFPPKSQSHFTTHDKETNIKFLEKSIKDSVSSFFFAMTTLGLRDYKTFDNFTSKVNELSGSFVKGDKFDSKKADKLINETRSLHAKVNDSFWQFKYCIAINEVNT